MNKLKPHPHAALIRRWAELKASGQVAAGWWTLRGKGASPEDNKSCFADVRGNWVHFSNVGNNINFEYRIDMLPAHPRYQVAQDWAKVKDLCTGEPSSGLWHYELELVFYHDLKNPIVLNRDYFECVLNRDYFECVLVDWDNRYLGIKKTKHHPDNCKPKLKLVDMAALPIGSEVKSTNTKNRYKALYISRELELLAGVMKSGVICSLPIRYIRIAEQEEFTYWGGGGCPVPDGLTVEIVIRDATLMVGVGAALDWWHVEDTDWGHNPDQDIIAYRITGLAEGWTDDPAKVGV